MLRQSNRTIDIAGGEQSWADIRNLTNEERDQIDLQARVILSRCKDRVAQLEELEKRKSSCTHTFCFLLFPMLQLSTCYSPPPTV